MTKSGITNQLNWLIIKVTLYSFLLSFATYALYPVVTSLIQGQHVDIDFDFGTTGDWIQLLISTLLTIFVSVMISARFARGMVDPILSLTDSARRVAEGDLSARAEEGTLELREISALVKDFNRMAETLETMSSDIRTWNAAIAHELRTPVTILRGRLQGLADGIFEPDQKLFKNLILQTDGLSRLIDDLRTLSLAQSGHLRIAAEHVNVKQVIESLANVVKADFKESRHSLVLKLNDIDIECDASRLRQALMALLENARRYAIPGVIMVSCEDVDGGALIGVEDEGPGIEPDIATTLWDAFVRSDHSRSRQSGGTGLGLAVVKAIILAHGGKVGVDKGALNGTRFTLWLPYSG